MRAVLPLCAPDAVTWQLLTPNLGQAVWLYPNTSGPGAGSPLGWDAVSTRSTFKRTGSPLTTCPVAQLHSRPVVAAGASQANSLLGVGSW